MKKLRKVFLRMIGIAMVGITTMIGIAIADYWYNSPFYNMTHIAVELGSATITGTTVIRLTEKATLTCTICDVNSATITDHLITLCGRGTSYVWSGSGTIDFPNSRTTTITPTQVPGTYTYKVVVAEPPILFPPDYPSTDQISTVTRTCYATWTLVILQSAITGVAMSPLNITLPVDGTVSLTGTITDQLGGVIAGAKGTFSCSNKVGTFSNNYGTNSILHVGTQALVGTIGFTAIDGTNTFATWTTIIITPGLPAIVLISPLTTNLSIGGSQTFRGTITDVYGNKISNVLNWSLSENLGALSVATGVSTTFTAGTPGTTLLTASTGTVQAYATITVQGIKYIQSQTARVPFTFEIVGGYNGIATVSVTTGTYTTANGTFTIPSTMTLTAGKGSITLLVSTYQTITVICADGTRTSNCFWVEGGTFCRASIEGLEGKYLMAGKRFPLIGIVAIKFWDYDNNLTSPQYLSSLGNMAEWQVNGKSFYTCMEPLSGQSTIKYATYLLNLEKGQKQVIFSPSFPLFECVPKQFPYIVSQNAEDCVKFRTEILLP
jgi:hypothetical protein